MLNQRRESIEAQSHVRNPDGKIDPRRRVYSPHQRKDFKRVFTRVASQPSWSVISAPEGKRTEAVMPLDPIEDEGSSTND